jgi:hypothetical protein
MNQPTIDHDPVPIPLPGYRHERNVRSKATSHIAIVKRKVRDRCGIGMSLCFINFNRNYAFGLPQFTGVSHRPSLAKIPVRYDGLTWIRLPFCCDYKFEENLIRIYSCIDSLIAKLPSRHFRDRAPIKNNTIRPHHTLTKSSIILLCQSASQESISALTHP